MTITTTTEKKPLLSNAVYDFIVNLVQLYLPATGTLYATLALLWGFPEPEKIVATIAAVTLFLGVVLKVSNSSYNKSDTKYDGNLVVIPSDDKDVYRFEATGPLEDLRTKKQVIFKVDTPI